LQEESIKRYSDLTIWRGIPSPLSTSPAALAIGDFAQFSITDKGLSFSCEIAIRTVIIDDAYGSLVRVYLVCLGTGRSGVGSLYLPNLGSNLFCREGCASVSFENLEVEPRNQESSETCILLETQRAISAALASRFQGIHVPLHTSFDFRHTHPETTWDQTDRMFLRPNRHIWADYPMVLVMKFYIRLNQTTVSSAVLCHYLSCGPVFKIFSQDQYPQEFEVISQARCK
jgi:hypothetical protein